MRVVDVPMKDALRWFGQGWREHFVKAPLAWLALLGLWLIATIILIVIPLIGQVAANILQPVLFAGIMLACRAQERGKDPQMNSLFAAFKLNLQPLIVAGCIIFFIELMVILLVMNLGLPEITTTPDGKSVDLGAFRSAMDGKEWIAVLFFLLVGLIKGVFWFVPPLLAFHDMKAGDAIRWSLYAFLSNFGAIFLYGVLVVGLMLLVILTYGAAMIVALPLLAITNYTGYKAMFVEDEPAQADPRTGAEA
ncbi:MAG: BPSS1780 family membrane protein [Burkholderiales bacterium]|nr:BPSS1780 family membrane protein [Burkholderiales bacterium]